MSMKLNQTSSLHIKSKELSKKKNLLGAACDVIRAYSIWKLFKHRKEANVTYYYYLSLNCF